MTIDVVRIATRKSPLAMWQAEHIKARLEQLYPNLSVELVPMTSRGDKLLDAPLAKVGGKGLFVKELEEAIFENRADIAVHSMKDVPMEFPQGLGLAVICEREDPTDAFVSNDYDTLDALPQGACVGTSSLRRQVQIQARRPDLKIRFLRGNVQTRLGKLDRGDFDAIVLATSGLKRVELAHRIKQVLVPEICLPAVGQGALGIETRSDDQAMQELLAPLNHHETWLRVSAERALNRRLEGGCQVPIGSYAVLENDGEQLYLRGLVGDPEGDTVLTSERRGPAGEAQALGIAVAEDLLAQGAGEILRRVYETQ